MNSRTDWNANLYLRFEDERTRPSVDLIQRVRLDAPRRPSHQDGHDLPGIRSTTPGLR